MARLVPTPQDLVEQLRRLLPLAHPEPAKPEPSSVDRILDAALAAFTEQGVRATTMSRVARDAGVSREWLYRRFTNRDGLIVAVAQREAGRFIDGLAVRAFDHADLDAAVTDTFVYSVEFFRDHALLQQVLQNETELVTGRILQDAAPIISTAVLAGATYLSALGDLAPDEATLVAEALVRLVTSTTLAPVGVLDLHDPEVLRRYAAVVVPGIIGAARGRVRTDR